MTALEIIRQYYDAFNRQDWDGMLALLTTDVQHDTNQGSSYIGLDHYRQFLQHMNECYEERLEDLVLMADPSGLRAACEFTVHGIYKKTDGDLPPATGQRYVLPAGAFLALRDGKIARVTTYYNLPLWIKLIST